MLTKQEEHELSEIENSNWYKDYAAEMDRYNKQCRKEKSHYKKELRGLINVTGLYKFLNESNDNWHPIGIFDFEKTYNEYKKREEIKLVNEEKGLEWMTYERVSCDEIRGVEHWYVYQITVGMEGDSFEGYLLLPLKNGKYFKVSYSC